MQGAKPKVIFFLKYGDQAASTRYRFRQFEDSISTWDYHFSFLLSNDYLRARLRNHEFKILPVLIGYARRLFSLVFVKRFDLAVIQYELFPYFPGIFEAWLRLWKVPYIVDLDDAIFHQYDSHRLGLVRFLLGKKISRILEGAQMVWAGNHYLAQYAKKSGADVRLFPTVIDMDRYTEKKWVAASNYSAENPFIVGWVGSPTTALFLHEIAPALKSFFAKVPGKLILVGSGKISLPGIPIEIEDWREETEINQIHRFDVGIMPLRMQSNWDKGKCAFKLIQYLGCGIPVVASNIGANADVVIDGVNGFLAKNQTDWILALEKIYQDRVAAIEMGHKGRDKIAKEYSKQSLQKVWIESLENSLSTKKRI